MRGGGVQTGAGVRVTNLYRRLQLVNRPYRGGTRVRLLKRVRWGRGSKLTAWNKGGMETPPALAAVSVSKNEGIIFPRLKHTAEEKEQKPKREKRP